MSYKLFVSEDAHMDIDGITHYIAYELNNLKAATDFLDDLEISYRHMLENPYIYALCSDVRLGRQGYRRVIIKNYTIFYLIDEEDKNVYVVRVMYSPNNYSDKL